ncbi:DNA-binding protein [Sandaracinomonas limnophila]|uniref:DNA-binding protein n=2 Tax=Sandaracinomonas limnophila TaxID=1862386 RepID=A0A437PPK8_9BACT|nr:DNA-binding protein [Sandaracinomonas limnophila]
MFFYFTKHMTVKMACEYLKVSRSTLGEWMKKGKIPFSKIGRSPRFDRDELDQWIKSGGIKTVELPPIPTLNRKVRYGNN